MYAIWLSENISMASTRGFFHQQKESLSPDEIAPTFTRKASKIRASLCQVQKGFARIALAFVGNGHKDDVVDIPVILTPHSGHTDPSRFLGQKDKNVTNLQFFS